MCAALREASSKKPARRLPPSVWLYSAGRITLDDARARAVASSVDGDLYSRARAILRAEGVVGLPDRDVDDLSLLDFHVLLALLLHAEVLHEPDTPTLCDNCGKESHVDAASTFEWGPFVDHELTSAEFDTVGSEPHALPLHTKRRRHWVNFSARSLGDVLPLLSLKSTRFVRRPLSHFLVEVLGIEPVPPTRRIDVLRALNRLGPRTMAAFADAWHRVHFTPRLSATHTCKCGAALVTRVPRTTLMDVLGREEKRAQLVPPPDFPDLLRFEKIVRDAKRSIYRAHAIGDLRLIVDDGVPAVDDAGVPLLGSYLPPGADPEERGEIRVYYRSFRDEASMDRSFDVAGEISETIEHEVIHHVNFLRGHDPMDEEERFVIAKERQQLIGRKELARRETAFWWRFVKEAWPFLFLVGLVAFVSRCFG